MKISRRNFLALLGLAPAAAALPKLPEAPASHKSVSFAVESCKGTSTFITQEMADDLYVGGEFSDNIAVWHASEVWRKLEQAEMLRLDAEIMGDAAH